MKLNAALLTFSAHTCVPTKAQEPLMSARTATMCVTPVSPARSPVSHALNPPFVRLRGRERNRGGLAGSDGRGPGVGQACAGCARQFDVARRVGVERMGQLLERVEVRAAAVATGETGRGQQVDAGWHLRTVSGRGIEQHGVGGVGAEFHTAVQRAIAASAPAPASWLKCSWPGCAVWRRHAEFAPRTSLANGTR